MLLNPEYFPYLCKGFLFFLAFLFICASYAYRVNTSRQNDDLQKRDFHFGAIFLAPFAWPIFALVYILFFMIRAVIFASCLALAILGLLVIRKPFLFIWLNKIGNSLLEANTLLIKIFFEATNKNHRP